MNDGWKIRHGVAGDLGGDVPWFAAGLIVVGGVIATVVHVLVDGFLCRHSKKERLPLSRESHRHPKVVSVGQERT